MSKIFATWYNPLNYGSRTNGREAIQAAHDAMPSTGGVIYIPPGDWINSGTIAITKPCTIMGQGMAALNNPYLNDPAHGFPSIPTKRTSSIKCTSPNQSGIVVNAYPVYIHDVDVTYAGSGIQTAGNKGIQVITGWGMSIERVSLHNFYDNLSIEDKAAQYSLFKLLITAPVRYGLYMNNPTSPDYADMNMATCVFMAGEDHNSATAIRIEGGGGIKATGIKINSGFGPTQTNRFLYGIDLNNTAGPTVDFILGDSSIENVQRQAIRMRAPTAWSEVQIHDVQFSPGRIEAYYPQIDIDGLDDIIINNIIGNAPGDYGSPTANSQPVVKLANCNNGRIGLISNVGYGSELLRTNCSNIKTLQYAS